MLAHDEILSYEDLLLIAETAVAAGIEKIRITGGEPLVRKDIVPVPGAAGRPARLAPARSDD